MTIIYPINGKNERLGELFKTPKHLLLYKGVPAIEASAKYMQERFPYAKIRVLANERYWGNPHMMECFIYAYTFCMQNTESQVDTLRIGTKDLDGPVMFVDCDIIPISINRPIGNTVYLFENKQWMKQYSNYKVENGVVVDCNEKGEYYPYAGAGIYYFEDVREFNELSVGCKSISEVIKQTHFKADTTSEVFRFGTLNDIKNDEHLIDALY